MFTKNHTTRVPNYTQIYFPYSAVELLVKAVGYLVHADSFSSPKPKRYLNEINTVNQLQLNYSTNIHLLTPRFMKSLCVVTIKLNTVTDVPYQMTVGGAFVYVCENM